WRHFSTTRSDDFDLCVDQSFSVVAFIKGNGWTKPEDCDGPGSGGYFWVRRWLAARPGWCRGWLLRHDDLLGLATYCLVRARHSRFLPRHCGGLESPVVFRTYSCHWPVRTPHPLRSLCIAACKVTSGGQPLCWCIPGNAAGCDETERFVRGRSSWL